jgi:hypothetical protein
MFGDDTCSSGQGDSTEANTSLVTSTTCGRSTPRRPPSPQNNIQNLPIRAENENKNTVTDLLMNKINRLTQTVQDVAVGSTKLHHLFACIPGRRG